jgi:hypothetical protein
VPSRPRGDRAAEHRAPDLWLTSDDIAALGEAFPPPAGLRPLEVT